MELFGYNLGNFPMRYLGVAIHFRKLSNPNWIKVEERFEKCLSTKYDISLTFTRNVLQEIRYNQKIFIRA